MFGVNSHRSSLLVSSHNYRSCSVVDKRMDCLGWARFLRLFCSTSSGWITLIAQQFSTYRDNIMHHNQKNLIQYYARGFILACYKLKTKRTTKAALETDRLFLAAIHPPTRPTVLEGKRANSSSGIPNKGYFRRC